MSDTETRQKLVDFLERKAFRPVLEAEPGRYPEGKRASLADVQRRTETEIQRFRNYRSAQEVVTNFRRDLNSDAAQKVHRELKALGLPTVNDVRTEFEELAGSLGVK
ncbi:MAG TPA: hypothetical protein VIZ17_11890 [Acetobacteraceae bacterium]